MPIKKNESFENHVDCQKVEHDRKSENMDSIDCFR